MVSATCTVLTQTHAEDDSAKDAREHAKKRRRFTGKAFKPKASETLIKVEPRDSLQTALQLMDVPPYDSNRISQNSSEEPSRAAQEVVIGGLLHEADRAAIGTLGSTDFVLLYFTLVADDVLP